MEDKFNKNEGLNR